MELQPYLLLFIMFIIHFKIITICSRTYGMPAFPLSISKNAVHLVRLPADDGCAERVDHLAPQQKITRSRVAEVCDVTKEHEKVREPHRGAEVIEHMTDAVRQSLAVCQFELPVFRHDHSKSSASVKQLSALKNLENTQ